MRLHSRTLVTFSNTIDLTLLTYPPPALSPRSYPILILCHRVRVGRCRTFPPVRSSPLALCSVSALCDHVKRPINFWCLRFVLACCVSRVAFLPRTLSDSDRRGLLPLRLSLFLRGPVGVVWSPPFLFAPRCADRPARAGHPIRSVSVPFVAFL